MVKPLNKDAKMGLDLKDMHITIIYVFIICHSNEWWKQIITERNETVNLGVVHILAEREGGVPNDYASVSLAQ